MSHFTVTTAGAYTSTTWDLDANGTLQHGDPHTFTNYSDEMRLLRDEYFAANPDYDKDAYHLFVIGSFDQPDLGGYMVRGKGIGFLRNNEDTRTTAHELAHGIFALEHTFPEIPQGTSDNLMDYSGGTHLAEWQWMLIQQPLPAFSVFDLEEEGEYSFDQDIPFYKDQKTFTNLAPEQVGKGFLLLNGKAYKFKPEDAVAEIVFDKYGRVYAFQVASGAVYKAFIGRFSGDPLCLGYLSEADYDEFKLMFPGATSFGPAQYDFVAARKYQFTDCPAGDLVYQRTVPYFHNGLPGGEFWIEITEGCLVEREFANGQYTSSGDYNSAVTTGVYIGPSINDAYYEVVEGDCVIDGSIAQLDEEGAGAPLYFCLKDETDNDVGLVEMVNYISALIEDKRYAFYDDVENKAELIGISPVGYQLNAGEVTCNALKREEIFTVAAFNQHYPKSLWFYARDVDSVISHENIRADVPDHYNVYSIDYASFETPHVKDWDPLDEGPFMEVIDYLEALYNYQVGLDPTLAQEENFQDLAAFIDSSRSDPYSWLAHKLRLRMNLVSCFDLLGVYDRYEYSLNDLMVRKGCTFINVIVQKEQDGMAIPIHVSDEASQYYNKYDTECAFFIGFEYMKMYVETVFEPVMVTTAIMRFQNVTKRYKTFKGTHGSADDVLKKGGGDAVSGTQWIDDLEELLGPGTRDKVYGWISDGLSPVKLEQGFAKATDKVDLFNRLDNANGIYHQRVIVEDWDNIPGVSRTDFVPNGLSGSRTNPWGDPDLDLSVDDAQNFVDATPVELPAGTKLYRVTGGNPAGGYWTLEKPNTLGDVIGGTAVRPQWNNFNNMYIYEVPAGQTLKVWKGTTASQQIADNVINPHLFGGDQQVFIPQVLRDEAFKGLIVKTSIPW